MPALLKSILNLHHLRHVSVNHPLHGLASRWPGQSAASQAKWYADSMRGFTTR
jgi:hypothetical protein